MDSSSQCSCVEAKLHLQVFTGFDIKFLPDTPAHTSFPEIHGTSGGLLDGSIDS
jgi:hypothetical protein